MTGLNWTRNKATSQAQQAARAARDDWCNAQRLERQLTAARIEEQRELRRQRNKELTRRRQIWALKRIWIKVQAHRWDLE